MPLTSHHLALLRTAAARQDHLLACPGELSPRARQALVRKLCQLGYAAAVRATAAQTCWGEDEVGPHGLQLTPEGLQLIAAEVSDEKVHPAATPRRRRGGTRRPMTKQARLLALLQRPEGATLAQLMASTGWLAHSTRAALTRLRQAGHLIIRSTSTHGESTYRIAAEVPCSTRTHG